MNSTPPCVSFVVILDFSARWKYLSESVSDLLGWEPSDLRERSFLELVHPDELAQVQQLLRETILSDKAAAVVYMRLKHKDAHKGYILSLVVSFFLSPSASAHSLPLLPTRSLGLTVVYDRVVGSVSFYSAGGKALHTNSTAQEITVITPAASNFEFRRWHDPPAASSAPSTSRPPLLPALNDPPPEQSPRLALLLDRFSLDCTVTYYSNAQLITPAAATRRAFFDFVARADEPVVRSWLEAIKTCGVNERGHPAGGGFGYGRFRLCIEGRDSSDAPENHIPTRRPPNLSARLTGWRGRARVPVPPAESTSPQVPVDAIFSAHSDGLVCILRRAQ
ncbi:hypothetical protein DFH07DRAFT_969744 [Mycena maculata]|uniref:PAS domain-containing protein n=1 Tax=Mycena maculata TaxID=230809 RepID=A0AAD7HWE6_9AGAR|nr:hypothetical protein DFH07DRAFT_969744 [Mycena maculata]